MSVTRAPHVLGLVLSERFRASEMNKLVMVNFVDIYFTHAHEMGHTLQCLSYTRYQC